MANSDWINIFLVYVPQSCTLLEYNTRLLPGSTVLQALLATDWQMRPEVQELIEKGPLAAGLTCGIWGRPCKLDRVLRDHDRVELYRPLLVDPKVARRERFAKQGSRGAGLFAGKRFAEKTGGD